MKGFVLYIDGGSQNPGPSGYGVHGYHYDTTLNAKPIGLSAIVASTHGYENKDLTKPGTTGGVVVELMNHDVVEGNDRVMVSPTQYVDMYGTVGIDIEGQRMVVPATNNQAELTAVLMALRYVVREKPDVVVFRPDSEYVIKGITEWMAGWVKRNWMRPDGSTIQNATLWQEVHAEVENAKALGILTRYIWIKGHSGDTGNERADKLATNGVNCAKRGQDHHVIQTAEPEGFWKYAAEKHPFLAHKRCYFNTRRDAYEPGIYALGDHGKDDSQQGKRISDAACSVVRLQQPDMVLEMMRDLQSKVAKHADVLHFAYLDRIFSPDIHRDLNTYGEIIIEPVFDTRTDLKIKRGRDVVVPLTYEQNPPLISWRVLESIAHLDHLLDQFLAQDPRLVSTDITDVLYESVAAKPVKPAKAKKAAKADAADTVVEEAPVEVVETTSKLKSSFVVGTPFVKVKAKYPIGEHFGEVDLTLTSNIDILDRNSLKRLESLQPKVHVVMWNEDGLLYRYATIVQAGKDVGIWSGVHSNFRLLT